MPAKAFEGFQRMAHTIGRDRSPEKGILQAQKQVGAVDAFDLVPDAVRPVIAMPRVTELHLGVLEMLRVIPKVHRKRTVFPVLPEKVEEGNP